MLPEVFEDTFYMELVWFFNENITNIMIKQCRAIMYIPEFMLN